MVEFDDSALDGLPTGGATEGTITFNLDNTAFDDIATPDSTKIVVARTEGFV